MLEAELVNAALGQNCFLVIMNFKFKKFLKN